MSHTITDQEAESIFRARLTGKSVRTIAKEFGLTTAEVAKIVETMCEPVSPATRRAALALDLERLDQLQTVFYERAMEGDAASAAIALKVSERRSALLGLDVPASVRGDPVQLTVQAAPETSTERIQRVLATLVAERPALPSGNGHYEPEADGSATPMLLSKVEAARDHLWLCAGQ